MDGMTIEIVVDENGNISGEVEDAVGAECLGELDALLADLGTVTKHVRTADFHKVNVRTTGRIRNQAKA